jgi:hypothetical protein
MTDFRNAIKLFGIVLIIGARWQFALQCLRHRLRNKVARVAVTLAQAAHPLHKVGA